MLATMTLVICLNAAPEVCELREVRVDAQLCFHGSRNTALMNVPEGYQLRSARCVPARVAISPRPAA
jgi:hypothetical protein